MTTGRKLFGILVLLATALLTIPNQGKADWIFWRSHAHNDCPPPAYPRVIYWFPELYRIHAYRQGAQVPMHAVDHHPEVPLDYSITSYPCPAVDPRAIPYGPGASRLILAPK
jgi:hypothetical protein